MAVACVTPPPILLIQSGDVELNPGPVEADKQVAVPVEGRREGGREGGGMCQGVWQPFAITVSLSIQV